MLFTINIVSDKKNRESHIQHLSSTKQSQVVRHKYHGDIYGSSVIPKLVILTMMVFLQSHCEQKSTKTSCEGVLEGSVRAVHSNTKKKQIQKS